MYNYDIQVCHMTSMILGTCVMSLLPRKQRRIQTSLTLRVRVMHHFSMSHQPLTNQVLGEWRKGRILVKKTKSMEIYILWSSISVMNLLASD